MPVNLRIIGNAVQTSAIFLFVQVYVCILQEEYYTVFLRCSWYISEQQGESAHWLPSLWNEGNYGGKGQVKPTAASTQDNSEAKAIVHLLEAFQGLERRRGMVSTKSPSTCPRGSCSKQMDAGDGSGRLSVTRWGHQTHLFTWRCLVDRAR